MNPTDEQVEMVAEAIRAAGDKWLKDNDTNPMKDFGWADIPEDVFARAAITSIYTSIFKSDGNEEQRWIDDGKNSCPHCGGSGHKDDVTAAGVKPRVKPLVWRKPGDHPQDFEDAIALANGLGGRYSITEESDHVLLWNAENNFVWTKFSSVQAAKAAAQADYEARIMSALTTEGE